MSIMQQSSPYQGQHNLRRAKTTPTSETHPVLFPNIAPVNSKGLKVQKSDVIYYHNLAKTETKSPTVTPPLSMNGQRKGTSISSSKPKSKHKKSSPSDSSDKKKHVKFDEKTFTIFDQRKSIDKVHISKKMSATPVTKALNTKTSPLSAKSTSPPTKAHNTFSTKRKIVDKPPEPFKVFLDPSHSMARVVWLYLLECKLPFEKIPISSKLRDKSQILPAYSNHCIFVDGDITLGQETAILRYITLNYTKNLYLGADISQISQSFSWIHWAASVLHRDLYYLTDGDMTVKGILQSNKRQIVQSSMDSVSLYLDMLEKILSERNYLLGAHPWFCDSVVALVLEDARSFSLKAWPRLLQWLVRIREHNVYWEMVTQS